MYVVVCIKVFHAVIVIPYGARGFNVLLLCSFIATYSIDTRYKTTETEMVSFWRRFHHWLWRKLSKWQVPVQHWRKLYEVDDISVSVVLFHLEFTKFHDEVIKWKHFPRYWPFVRGIHRCPGNSQHKSQWRGALMFSLICVWINAWVSNRGAGDLRRHRVHYDVIVM